MFVATIASTKKTMQSDILEHTQIKENLRWEKIWGCCYEYHKKYTCLENMIITDLPDRHCEEAMSVSWLKHIPLK